MTKVYIVTQDVDYEGSQIEAAFSTEQFADFYANKRREENEKWRGIDYSVNELELDIEMKEYQNAVGAELIKEAKI